MAGKSYIKVGYYDWDRIKKMYIKTGGQTWTAIRKSYVKTSTGWRKVFDTASNRPFIAGNDIPKIRLNTFRTGSSYNPTGTVDDPVDPVVEAPPVQQMGPSWTSPTLGWPYESLGRHLWGYDGTWTSGNGSSMTFVYTWLYNLTGNSNDNTAELNATSTTGRTDMLTNLSSHLGQSDGDYFDKNFLTFRVTATNSAGNASAESAPVYIVREVPTGSITMVSPGTAATNSTMSASFTYSNNWYNKTNVSNSYIEWFAVDNLGDSLTNSNRVQIEYLSSIAVTGTTSKSGTAYHVPTIGNKYYYVRMTLNNSGTENAVISITGFTPKSSVTSQANKTAKTGIAATSPTSITATNNGSATTVSISWSGASNAVYYRVRWASFQDTSVDPAVYYDKQITASNSTSGSWNWGPSDPDKDGAVPYPGTAYYYHVSSSADGTTWSPYTVSSTAVGTVQSYNVAWNGNGGSTGNEGIPWSFTAGGSVTVPSATRIGYTFLRWADTESGNYTYTTTGGTFFPPSQNITMYARWQINVCTIPNVIGMTEINASNAVNAAGFLYEYVDYIDTTNASIVGTVAAIDPPVGSQPGCGTNITLTLYRLSLKLSTPTGVDATDARTDGVNVTWNAVSGAAYYGVWYGGAPGYDALADFGGNRNTSLITGTSYLDTSIGSGVTRDYYVQAYKSGDPTGTKSEWGGPNSGTRASAAVITYGNCEIYGSPYFTTSGYDCYGDYSYAWTDNYYSQRRQILSNGTWTGSYDYSCADTSVRTYGSFSQVNGQCGYSPPSSTPAITSGPSISWASGNNFTLSATASNATNLEFQVQFANNDGGPALFTDTFFFGAGSGGGTTGAQQYSWARTRVRANNSSTGLSSSFSGYTGWA
jgi:beta-lactam-binding protein with PASTA domain